MARGRNYPCPCGSGLKYKRCCEGNRALQLPRGTLLVVLGVVVAGCVAGAAIFAAVSSNASSGKVRSKEHGHWHNEGQSGANDPIREPVPQPPGPAPFAKVSSAEHGHWHDVVSGTTNSAGASPTRSGSSRQDLVLAERSLARLELSAVLRGRQ